MDGFADTIIALIVGRSNSPFAPKYVIHADLQLDLAEQHRRWCIKKEKDRIRSEGPSKPLPVTLHAEMHHRSVNIGTRASPLPSLRASCASSEPCPKFGAKILMPTPHFLNVHSHYARGLNSVASNSIESPEVMQTYNFNQIDAGRRIGFYPQQNRKAIRRPPRKINDLEKLPPLSSRLAGEIEHKKKVLDQAVLYAQIREKQEIESERQRRNSTAQQHPMPPFVLNIDRRHLADDGHLTDTSTPPITPPTSPPQLTRPACGQQSESSKDVVDNHMNQLKALVQQDLVSKPGRQPHVRWAPNLVQQKQKRIPTLNAQQQPPHVVPFRILRRRRSSNCPSNLRKVIT